MTRLPDDDIATAMRHCFSVVVVVVIVIGCAATRVETTIPRDQIGTKYARITGYFATRGAAPGGPHTEETTGSIRHEVIRDEATLTKMTSGETCMDVVVRTHSTHDEPFDQLQPTCTFDGEGEARAVIDEEMISIFDYSYTGALEVAHLEGATLDQYLSLSLSQPAEKIFRVIERRGSLCCPAGGRERVELDLTHPYWNVADYKYHLVFDWRVR